MKIIEPKAGHEAFYQDVSALLQKHSEGLKPVEMLAISSQIVGKLLAMQDPIMTSPAAAMETVQLNIAAGNKDAVEKLQAIEQLHKPQGSA